jgi:3-methyladenine DNA glycosylase AlkD
MDVAEVMAELEKLGSESTRRIFKNHGAPAAMYGVKVADLKTIAKKIRGRQDLALALYDTGNSDAQYLAGLVADGKKMTVEQLDRWAAGATWYMLSEYAVAWVAAESPHGREIALKWIESPVERVACAGWATYGGWLALKPDAELDLAEIERLLDRIAAGIHQAPNRVRYVMNGFVIAVGSYVRPLGAKARAVAAHIGKVHVDLGGTACKVPLATEYIAKVEAAGKIGAKKKTVKC